MIDEMPAGWTTAPLRELLTELRTGPFGSALHKSDYVDGGIPVINPMNLIDGRIVPSANKAVGDSTAKRLQDYAVREGDLVLGRRGEMGRCAVVSESQSGWLCGTGSAVLRFHPGFLPPFARYLISSPAARSYLSDASVGTTMENLNQQVLKDWQVPVPPVDEQQRIVAKLDALLARVRASQERLATVPAILKRFRQSVLARACTGGLTADWRKDKGLGLDWEERSLRECGTVSGGLTKNSTREKLSLQLPYLRVANVYRNELRLADVTRIGLTESEFARTALKRDDLLFVEGNGSLDQIGRVALWDGSIPRCVHQNHLIKFRAGVDVAPAYVLFQMMAPQGREQLTALATSTAGLHTLSISKISAIRVPLPTKEEQWEIIRRVQAFFAFADRLEVRLKNATRQVDELTQSILAKAFRGELVLTEAELAKAEGRAYETAEELLKRVRSNCASAAGRRTRRK